MKNLELHNQWHYYYYYYDTICESAQCVARDLDTIMPGPLEPTCQRQFAVQ